MKRYLLSVIVMLPAVVMLLASSVNAEGDKAGAWKTFLPADAFKVLAARSITAIEAIAKSGAKDAAEKIEAEAAILVGYTMSVKNPGDDVRRLHGAAIKAVQSARSGDAKKLVGFGKTIASAPKADLDMTPRKAYLQELQWMMETFRGKAKGGEGLHVDLQYHPKLKNLNGTEAFLGAIAGKKLSDENLDKVAKELPNFAYRVAVMGSITHEFPPAKDAGQWRDLSLQMRDSALALAAAASKKNADGVLKAAQALENSCTKCHMVFKKT